EYPPSDGVSVEIDQLNAALTVRELPDFVRALESLPNKLRHERHLPLGLQSGGIIRPPNASCAAQHNRTIRRMGSNCGVPAQVAQVPGGDQEQHDENGSFEAQKALQTAMCKVA